MFAQHISALKRNYTDKWKGVLLSRGLGAESATRLQAQQPPVDLNTCMLPRSHVVTCHCAPEYGGLDPFVVPQHQQCCSLASRWCCVPPLLTWSSLKSRTGCQKGRTRAGIEPTGDLGCLRLLVCLPSNPRSKAKAEGTQQGFKIMAETAASAWLCGLE